MAGVKLVLNTFAIELSRRVNTTVINAQINVICPGPVNSNIIKEAPPLLRAVLRAIFTVIFKSPKRAALAPIYLGVSADFHDRSVGVELDASDAVHFTLDFAPATASSIAVRSTLIERLPRGHRQYVTVRTRTGELLTETILDASHSSIRIETGVP